MPNKKLSSGLLLYRVHNNSLEVLIGHMGGPFWEKKDRHGWSIPKGEYEEGEDPWAVALREFEEELGSPPPLGEAALLGQVKQPSGKVVTVFALEGDFDASHVSSNHFELEWPKGSGRLQSFPEIDRAGWFAIPAARTKLIKGQHPFLDLLIDLTGIVTSEKDASAEPEQGELFS